ncbi:thioredoxin family protein [Haloarcula onubensis]|uniref:Thioredoxin family protein n=1 Tax=Haloarcula onubensis TaxID=2950539 RepID=A0ABU2FIS2_9EURY|nr:thioredoxin family protein [Halomicroarcula sp. S3CR25-11]MDS0280660.1 thioredoxin family protein [Halomicroarcula sp. S3CR25-11]
MSPVETVRTREELDALLADRERVLVMVRTAGCAICRSMEPILDGVARATQATVVEFNPREDLDAVADFAVRSVPTFLLFVDGELVARRADGFVPTAELEAFVADA